MYPAAHPWPSRMHQSRWTSRWMRVVKYHPGTMVLAGIGVLAHVEPADALGLSTRTAANGAAVITSTTRFPAIH